MSPVFTIGHSTRMAEEFIRLLKAFKIELLADIRTIPRSRKNPQFESGVLSEALRNEAIDYIHVPALGGLRHPNKDSINTAWRNDSFRGYADYMQTEAFFTAIADLICIARNKRTAMMCAEAVPWRCHRSLVSDALLARGIGVIDILSATSSKEHKLTPWAQVEGTRVTYPKAEDCATM
ncbi:MAG: DUF488 domain-containing protein [Acidobacteriota bacterium]|nr:DUF488 domain-containing protein [Acidobacteriota bacterium]